MTPTRRFVLGGALSAAVLPHAAAHAAPSVHADPETAVPHVVELRQYTLFGGRRDTLIELFEREFIEPQNALGAQVVGTFTDLDDPDRFVWLRGFDTMAIRGEALPAFYTGPVWQAHRAAANTTMKDCDNVLLLNLASGSLAGRDGAAVYTVDIHYLAPMEAEAFAAFHAQTIQPRLAAAGAETVATLVSSTAENNFPRLPVRQREIVFVHIAAHASLEALEAADRRLAASGGWRDTAPEALLPALMRKPERLRLAPTARSALT